ncbi:MAG: hypothetical protein U0840_24535 [Gemmataceae bacterium]
MPTWALLACAWIAGAAPAETEPLPSLRRLCIDAPVVLLAAPVDPLTPVEFRVSVSLRGGLLPGETIRPQGLTAEQVRSFDEPDPMTKKPRPRRIAQALLFVEPMAGGKGYRLLPGGLRLCAEDGTYLVPTAKGDGMVPAPALRWPVVALRVKHDLASLDQLQSYRRIGRPARRVEALLSWIQERRGDFMAVGQGTEEAPSGWDRLQVDVFDWILAAATPSDAWRAVRLYAELNQGDLPRLPRSPFGTPAGRMFLLEVAADPRLLLGARLRALQVLAQPTVLGAGAAEPVQPAEVAPLLDRLADLLGEKKADVAVGIAPVLLTLADRVPDRMARILPALVQAYRAAQPGPTRDDLALVLCRLAPPAQWKELTGNPAGYLVCLRDLSRNETHVTFWLTLRTPGPAVFEAPTLVVEKLGPLGFVAEVKRYPVEPMNLDGGWAAGWSGADALVVQVDAGKFPAGSTYRVRVEGTAGQGTERVKWTSEPKKIVVPLRSTTGTRSDGILIQKN